MESLTPGILGSSMVLILVCAPFLTALLSLFFLRRYRRAVLRSMSSMGTQAIAGSDPLTDPAAAGVSMARPIAAQPGHLYRIARAAPLRDAMGHATAVLIAAVPLSLAAQFVYPTQLGVAGFSLGLWLYAWPLVPMSVLILPRSMGIAAGLVLFWLLVYALLVAWAGSYSNVAQQSLGGITIPARSGVTPPRMALMWLAVNGLPTALCILCFNPMVRAVAPLVLALVTLLLGGFWSAWLWLYMPAGQSWLLSVASATLIDVDWVLLSVALLLLAGFSTMSWAVVRWMARAYRDKSVSDRSLALDAIYLMFAVMYGLWLVMGAMVWIACIPAAFVLYKVTLIGARHFRGAPPAPHNLCFLRVFALGRRGENLREALARYWRSIGSIQLIAGPDVATGTVQPHQFLDFLSGKLDRHFIDGEDSLARSVGDLDRSPDPDGRYRTNSLFCYANSWQAALPALAGAGSSLMMDLRGFSADNAGCLEELEFLVAQVPAYRCLLVVDGSTDRDLLQATLLQALADVPNSSVNAGAEAGSFRTFEFTAGDRSLRRMLRLLCDVPAQAR